MTLNRNIGCLVCVKSEFLYPNSRSCRALRFGKILTNMIMMKFALKSILNLHAKTL